MYLLQVGVARARSVHSSWARAPFCEKCSAAAELLMKDFGIPSDVWSVTSFNELRRDALEVERWNQLHPE